MIQCFVDTSFETSFEHGKLPRLLSTSKYRIIYVNQDASNPPINVILK